jgi:hypothetical protein
MKVLVWSAHHTTYQREAYKAAPSKMYRSAHAGTIPDTICVPARYIISASEMRNCMSFAVDCLSREARLLTAFARLTLLSQGNCTTQFTVKVIPRPKNAL